MSLLEICVEDVAGIEAAVVGGAGRIELCSALAVGGLTPHTSLMQIAARQPVPVRALCRPRAGDFAYSDAEIQQIAQDAALAVTTGLNGVVIGAGTASGLDRAALVTIMDAARKSAGGRTVGFTLHRVFDLLDDTAAALELAVELGFDTILTSGTGGRAIDAQEVLEGLVRQAAGRITILAAGGIDAAAVERLSRAGVTAFHASCRSPHGPANGTRLHELGFLIGADLRTDRAKVAGLRDAIGRLVPPETGQTANGT